MKKMVGFAAICAALGILIGMILPKSAHIWALLLCLILGYKFLCCP